MLDKDISVRSLGNEELANAVAERESYLEEVTDFIRDVALAYGSVVSRKEGGYGYKTQWTLDGFHGFDLEFYSKLHDEYTVASDGQTLFSLRETEDSFSVERYDVGDWEETFSELVANPDETMLEYEEEQERREEHARQMEDARKERRERQKKREELLEQAEKLGLT